MKDRDNVQTRIDTDGRRSRNDIAPGKSCAIQLRIDKWRTLANVGILDTGSGPSIQNEIDSGEICEISRSCHSLNTS